MSIIFTAPPASFECFNTTIPKCAESCPAHEFDRTVFEETIITTWDLVCENAQWANVSQLIFMFGILLGNVIFGTIADKYNQLFCTFMEICLNIIISRIGRRIPLVIAVFIQIVSGIATAFVPWFWLYIVMRFITAVSTGGTMTTRYVFKAVGITFKSFCI